VRNFAEQLWGISMSAISMSPLRYQKHLRLLSARRQLLAGDATAAQVAHTVGYTSSTQFSRDYRAFYGLPPVQDITRLRAGTGFRDRVAVGRLAGDGG
jgi:transcriptional regulator GlxA family with amidase domain